MSGLQRSMADLYCSLQITELTAGSPKINIHQLTPSPSLLACKTMPSAGLAPAPTPAHAVEDATAVIAAALNVAHNGANVAVTAWCLVLLDPDGVALLRKQRPVYTAPLSVKRPLERVRVSPWKRKSHGRARIVVRMERWDLPLCSAGVPRGRCCCTGCLLSATSGPLQSGIVTLIASLALVMDKRGS